MSDEPAHAPPEDSREHQHQRATYHEESLQDRAEPVVAAPLEESEEDDVGPQEEDMSDDLVDAPLEVGLQSYAVPPVAPVEPEDMPVDEEEVPAVDDEEAAEAPREDAIA